MDVSVFHGALRARPPAPLTAPVSPWSAAPQAAPTPSALPSRHAGEGVIVVFAVVLAAVSLLAMLVALASK